MTHTAQPPAVLRTPAAEAGAALAHFSARLSFETDASDVHADLEAGAPGLVVVDSRSAEAWDLGHVPGAVHLPTADVPRRAAAVVPAGAVVVTYCWGPGCNGAVRAARAFARLGFRVKEMTGGYEYWVREGFPVRTATGIERRPADGLAAPRGGVSCAC
ncbi:rhodanese-like domain-containing protein [Streptomyces avicenniae]|uniref:rhodanese-like domain-containing protein n=1 Tax=Streptomyces avicenniae TaxID=500153 RepID=UPI000699E43B|nr:rhodanese-like domain-containing protein [Streptomyces avicenniae]